MTIRHVISIASCLVVLTAVASAQSPDAQTPPPPPVEVGVVPTAAPPSAGTPQTPAPPTPAPAQAPVARPGVKTTTQTPQAPPPQTLLPPKKIRGREVNVQIELTISEQVGTAAPEKRVVTMLVADAAFGRIRSNAGNGMAVLNIDATPTILENDRIATELTIEHVPALAEGASPLTRPAALNEMLTVILQNDKSMLISRAADPRSDRRITVEVRATIVK